jgi:hypothetical protein
MSKELELLGVALDFLDPRRWLDPADQHVLNILTRDIEELLAQPEQSNEPVAWFYERQIEGFTERTMSVGFEENFDGVTIPLYLEPPRRETLREHIDNHKVWYQIGYEKAKQELEPLCRHSIDQAYMASNFDNYYDCFDDGIKFAERCHGITGVGDE